ncbi:MAG TPA: PSD1 and planctomycete cytochrome C domain-containing protein [Gemmataceae bacterium]|nr:PSD1 and planctomycete cytochrome C domain-containing protein [Gemmataceae bacterium]
MHLGSRSLLAMFAVCLGINMASAQAPDFTREVRPILARYCFKCHGPDEKTRKAKLRLDVPIKPDDVVIAPGSPSKSELVARIHAKNVDAIMPPASTKMVLSDTQKKVLTQWIASGAKFEQHWAFVPPRPADTPTVRNKSWVRNPIDAFVLARLEKESLEPSPRADARTLIRRLSLDLIGLPPTLEETEEFVTGWNTPARRDAVYEAAVDRLLASPRYGERWARRWLDLARYADTNGYEKDRPRIIWPYRDWVIKALNDDMPFDQFTIEQIAGDMLPNPTPAQIVATGFHRNTMVNEEGGIDPLEFRYYAVVDRVNTTGTTWLGLTMGCAQCHSHKYDPLSQREFYETMAFLNNADEPDYLIPDPAIAEKRFAIARKAIALENDLAKKFPGGEEALQRKFAEWNKAESARGVTWQVLRPSSMTTNMADLDILPDDSIVASGDQSKRDTYALTFKSKLAGVTALRLEAIPHDSLPDRGPGRTYYEGRKGDFFLSEITALVDGKPTKFSGASHDFASGGAKGGAKAAIDGNPLSGWSTADQPGKRHAAVFNFEKPVNIAGEMHVTLLFERYFASALGRFRISVTTDVRRAEATSHGADIEAIFAKAERTGPEKKRLMRRFLEVAPELAGARTEIEKLRATMPAHSITMVMKERSPAHPRATHIHHRGEFLQTRERVTAKVPAVFPPLPSGAPNNRLGFARWLVAPENPLTSRVTVNRQWQAFFGHGIVRTTEDFGLQGEMPTHPELLDWLAQEFVRQKWSMKRLHKLIVMSAAYQQSSRVAPALLAKDPQNRLLARGPRVRLEAEQIRDNLLAVSGLLSAKIGGPSVFPPQPASVTTEGVYGAIKWKPSTGEDRYRRGLYTFLKRSIPYAMFATFDGVTGEICQARRDTSNSPLQALTMLNDQVVLECAQALGTRIADAPGTVEERVELLFRRCLMRTPTKDERDALAAFHHRQHGRLKTGALNAKTIAGSDGGDLAARAAWTLTARAVMNLDEMITKE